LRILAREKAETLGSLLLSGLGVVGVSVLGSEVVSVFCTVLISVAG